MIQLGLTGYPLGHSLSPAIHVSALRSCGLDGSYSLFPVAPDDQKGLKDLLERVRCGELLGLNVTIPHKQIMIPLLDELTPTATAIGAVNTIYRKENKLVGDNTDAPGFLADLNRFLHHPQSKINDQKSAIVLGAGGSARAVVYALCNDGWNVTVAARRMEQAEQLARSFPNYQLSIAALTELPLSTFDLLVNSTPLGMTPNINTSPLFENTVLSKDTFVYDLVYNPRETKLVRDARAQGCPATTGLGMLIEQAALAFATWTGHNPPREILYQLIK